MEAQFAFSMMYVYTRMNACRHAGSRLIANQISRAAKYDLSLAISVDETGNIDAAMNAIRNSLRFRSTCRSLQATSQNGSIISSRLGKYIVINRTLTFNTNISTPIRTSSILCRTCLSDPRHTLQNQVIFIKILMPFVRWFLKITLYCLLLLFGNLIALTNCNSSFPN